MTPFPAAITTSLNYPVYYPASPAHGYSYQADSAKIRAGLLFYTLVNGQKKIFVTEQNVPASAINLSSLPKHSPLDVPIGQAVIGTGLGNPSIVIMTPTTLIELTSNKGVSKAEIISVAQSLVQQN